MSIIYGKRAEDNFTTWQTIRAMVKQIATSWSTEVGKALIALASTLFAGLIVTAFQIYNAQQIMQARIDANQQLVLIKLQAVEKALEDHRKDMDKIMSDFYRPRP